MTLDLLFRVPRKKGKVKVVDPPAPPLEHPVADTHAHLSMIDAPASLARCAYHGVDFVCCMADAADDAADVYGNLDAWARQGQALADQLGLGQVPRLRISAGVHPHNAKDYTDQVEQELMGYLADPRTVAVGEVGLDYHYDLSPREVQRQVFRRQIRLAAETGLQLILHVREAHDEALAILDEEGFDPRRTLLHCCSLSPDELRPWVQRGYRIAYGGAFTFANSQACREAAHLVPLDAMVTETDSPYMAPVPLRGSECGPEHTIFTAAAMAAEFGCEPGEPRRAFLEQLHRNALDFLDKEPTSWQLAQQR